MFVSLLWVATHGPITNVNVICSGLYLQVFECRNSSEGFPTDHLQLVVADIPATEKKMLVYKQKRKR
jgi:hypothetical protein